MNRPDNAPLDLSEESAVEDANVSTTAAVALVAAAMVLMVAGWVKRKLGSKS